MGRESHEVGSSCAPDSLYPVHVVGFFLKFYSSIHKNRYCVVLWCDLLGESDGRTAEVLCLHFYNSGSGVFRGSPTLVPNFSACQHWEVLEWFKSTRPKPSRVLGSWQNGSHEDRVLRLPQCPESFSKIFCGSRISMGQVGLDFHNTLPDPIQTRQKHARADPTWYL